MKKVICSFLILCLLFSAAACTRTITFRPGQVGGGGTELPSYEGENISLSAQMFDNARVDLGGAESIGLVAEEGGSSEPVSETIEKTYIVRFDEDGSFEKITFVYTTTEEYGDGSYEVTQEQIEPNPVKLYATKSFIFVAYSDSTLYSSYFEDPDYNRNFYSWEENFLIDRATGKLYSLAELGIFYVHGDGIISKTDRDLIRPDYYSLTLEGGALTVTDLMPNKNIDVDDVCKDNFGNFYVQNESIAQKEGNIVYVTDRVRIGDDGYAYVFRNELYVGDIRDSAYYEPECYTVKRYGSDGVLEEQWLPGETVIRFPDRYSSEEGYVSLLGNEMYVINADGRGAGYIWYGTLTEGEANTYAAEAYLPNMYKAYPVSPRLVVVQKSDGEIWYYDLPSQKTVSSSYFDVSVKSFENQGLIMTGNSLACEGGDLYVYVEEAKGTLIYKLTETSVNGLPAMTASLQQTIEYEAVVLVLQPLN